MILWVDAPLSPHISPWLTERFDVEAFSVRRLGLRDAKDHEIFDRARREGAVIMTKDRDFVSLLEREGPPPQVLWITAGSTSNTHSPLRTSYRNVRYTSFLSPTRTTTTRS